MSQVAIGFGIVLILLGGGFFAATHAPTAAIPAVFGVLLLLCGWMATNPKLRMHAMHFAALLGLLGTIFPLIRAVPKAMQGTFNPPIIEQLAIAVLSLIFLVLCVRSFIAARVARRAAEGTAVQ
jgi:hypothetical protein